MKKLLFLLVISLSSCTPFYYAPNTINVPLLKQKGDMRLSLDYGLSTSSNSTPWLISCVYQYNLQFANAFEKNTGLIINANTFYSSSINSYYIETGIGIFKGDSLNMAFINEFYAGLGYLNGSVKSSNSDNTNIDFTCSAYRIFFLWNIGQKYKYFEYAFSLRLNNLNYYNIKGNENFVKGEERSIDILNKFNPLTIEPAITFRFGFEKIKLQGQLIYPINLNTQYKVAELSMSAGIILDLGKAYK